MNITQTVVIPVDHRLFVEVPHEVPTGKIIITYSAMPDGGFDPDGSSRSIQANDNIKHSNAIKLKTKLQNLQGSLGKNAFGGMNGVTYQQKVRAEWDE